MNNNIETKLTEYEKLSQANADYEQNKKNTAQTNRHKRICQTCLVRQIWPNWQTDCFDKFAATAKCIVCDAAANWDYWKSQDTHIIRKTPK